MPDFFDELSIPMDAYCISNDIDDYDLFAERVEETPVSEFANNLILE